MSHDPTFNRTILGLSGSVTKKFLQDLVTNDVDQDGLVYSALLSPQGKYLFDFFIFNQDDKWFLDVQSDCADALLQRLTMYKLRADVQISKTDLRVSRGVSPDMPNGAFADPRHPELGWRYYGLDNLNVISDINWDAIRVDNCIPETGIELLPNETYILETGFERLNGVDFKKGCYVGQEVTARMKHKTTLQKGLARVSVSEAVPKGTEITADGKAVGTIFTQSGNQAIAYLRFARAKRTMQAGLGRVVWNSDT